MSSPQGAAESGAVSAVETLGLRGSSSVRESFSEEEAGAYEGIVDEWREYYGLEAPDKLHTLSEVAIEIIRLVRIDEFLEREAVDGIIKIRERYGPDGEVIRE